MPAIKLTLANIVEILSQHECFDDILAITRRKAAFHDQRQAFDVLKLLGLFYQRELEHNIKALRALKEQATRRYLATQAKEYEFQIARKNAVIKGIRVHHAGLWDYLDFHASKLPHDNTEWIWRTGEKIPKRPKISPFHAQEVSKKLQLPHVRMLGSSTSIHEASQLLFRSSYVQFKRKYLKVKSRFCRY